MEKTYPDVTVVCGSVETDAEDSRAVTDPTLIVEVLSDSTVAYDRGDKFEHYRQIPKLQAYVLVSHRERRIETRRRVPDGGWSEHVAGRARRSAPARRQGSWCGCARPPPRARRRCARPRRAPTGDPRRSRSPRRRGAPGPPRAGPRRWRSRRGRRAAARAGSSDSS